MFPFKSASPNKIGPQSANPAADDYFAAKYNKTQYGIKAVVASPGFLHMMMKPMHFPAKQGHLAKGHFAKGHLPPLSKQPSMNKQGDILGGGKQHYDDIANMKASLEKSNGVGVEIGDNHGGKGGHDPPLKPRLRKRVSEFADYTSTHGLPHVKRVHTVPHKLFWFLCFFSMMGGFLYQAVTVTTKYLSNPYTVLVDIKFERTIAFPAITFCNSNPIRASAMGDLWVQEGFEDYFGDWFDYSSESGSGESGSGMSDPVPPTPPQRIVYNDTDDFWDRQDYEYDDDESYMDEDQLFQDVIQELDAATKKRIGHQLQTMLLRCRFQFGPCGPSNFTYFHNAKHGNCFTFNGGQITHKTASRPGPEYGLTLELYLETHEYLPELTDTAGIVVVLHDQNNMPLPDEEGILIPPGFETRLGVRRFEVQRLGDPYYTCWKSSKGGKHNIYSHIVSRSYSYSICQRSCYQHALADECGCGDSAYPLDNPDLAGGSLPACKNNNDTQQLCLRSVYTRYERGKLGCDCEQACKDISFYANPSSSIWPIPTEDGQASVINNYLDDGHPAVVSMWESLDQSDSDMLLDSLRDNVARLRVYFEDLNYEKVYQEPSYNINSLISDIGGNMGMFIGMSLMTAVEYGELIGYLFYTVYQKYKWSNNLRKVPPANF